VTAAVTATLVSPEDGMIPAWSVKIRGAQRDGPYLFEGQGTLSPSGLMTGQIPMEEDTLVLPGTVGVTDLVIEWEASFCGDDWVFIGDSHNRVFRTWGAPFSPSAPVRKPTVPRLEFLIVEAGNEGKWLPQEIARAVGVAVAARTDYDGTYEMGLVNPWEQLDLRNPVECKLGTGIVEIGAEILGVPGVSVTSSFASTDSDVTSAEFQNGDSGPQLKFSVNGPICHDWSAVENQVRVEWGSVFYHFTVIPDVSPLFVGTGSTETERDKDARWRILDHVRNNTDYFQRWGGGEKVDGVWIFGPYDPGVEPDCTNTQFP
jgi:hypothetical protein